MASSLITTAGFNFLLGAIGILGFAPFSLWPFTLLSFTALLISIHKKSAIKAALLGFFWGMGFYTAGINWIFGCLDTFGHLPIIASFLLMLVLISYLSLFPALFSYFSARFLPQTKKIAYTLGIAVFWFTSEWIRSTLFTGFPWLLLGYSQTDGPLQSFAPLMGVRGISFVLCLIAMALTYLSHALRHKNISWKPLLFIALCFTSSGLLYKKLWVDLQNNRATHFALVQGNVSQQKKWQRSEKWPTIRMYTRHTTDNWDADIIVWPEAAIPAFEFELPSYLEALDTEAKKNKSALISGILDFIPTQKHYYNNLIVLGLNGTQKYKSSQIPRYSKHHLTPFGEFIPLEPIFKALSNILHLPYSSFTRGPYRQKNLQANHKKLAAAMCYEIIFDQQVKDNVQADTDFILTASNDTWFGSSIGPLQHMQIAQMRARELQKPLIRATNNGVTAVTDALGDITHKLPQFQEAVLTANVIPTLGLTPFNVYGYWPFLIFSVIYILSLAYFRLKKE